MRSISASWRWRRGARAGAGAAAGRSGRGSGPGRWALRWRGIADPGRAGREPRHLCGAGLPDGRRDRACRATTSPTSLTFRRAGQPRAARQPRPDDGRDRRSAIPPWHPAARGPLDRQLGIRHHLAPTRAASVSRCGRPRPFQCRPSARQRSSRPGRPCMVPARHRRRRAVAGGERAAESRRRVAWRRCCPGMVNAVVNRSRPCGGRLRPLAIRPWCPGLTLLLAFQLLGEVIARAAHLSVPGPVIGMALMALAAGARCRG